MTLRRTLAIATLTSAGLISGCAQSNLVPKPLKTAFAQASRRIDGPAAARAADDRDNKFAMARLCEQRGELDAAHKLYNECLAEQPNHPDAYHRLAILAAEAGKLDEAMQHFEQALTLAPPKTELLSDLGYCYYLLDDLQSAERVLRDGLQQQPNDQAICNNLALVCSETGRFEEALSLFKRVNTEAEAYSNIAYAYSQVGELEKSQEYYSRALSVNENLRVAAEAMMQVAQRQSQFEQPVPTQQTMPQQASQEPTIVAQIEQPPQTIPTTETSAWQSQQEAGVQLASQNAPVAQQPAPQQPEVFIEDGPLRWRSPDGKPATSIGFVGSAVDTTKIEMPAEEQPKKSFLEQQPGTTIRDDNVRPISAELPISQDVEFQGVQTAVYQYPMSSTPHASAIQPAAYAEAAEPGLMPVSTGDAAPRPLPQVDTATANGRLSVLNFPFIPKRN